MSILNMALLFVGVLSTAVFYRDLVANPISAGRALMRFYQLPAEHRQEAFCKRFRRRGGHRAGGPGAHRGSGRWAMSAGTESLIRAIKPTTRWPSMGGCTLKGRPTSMLAWPAILGSHRWRSRASCTQGRPVGPDLGGALCRDGRAPWTPGPTRWSGLGSGSWCDGGTRGSWSGDGWTKAERWRRSAGRSLPGHAGMVWTPTGRRMVPHRASSASPAYAHLRRNHKAVA